MSKTTDNKNDLFVRIKATRALKQDLNELHDVEAEMIAVEVHQKQTASEEVVELNIHIQRHN